MKLGLAFGEGITKKSRQTGRTGGLAEVFGEEAVIGRVETDLDSLDNSISSWRVLLFTIILVVCFGLLFTRLFKLSVIEGERNLALSDGNRVMTKIIHAQRGVIYDRNGRMLVRNAPAFRLFKPSGCENIKTEKWGEPKEFCSGYRLISRDEALAITAKGGEAAKRLEVDSLRQYIYKESLAHVLGYTGEIGEEELSEKSQRKNYVLGDRVGRTGIEEEYEDVLRGIDGREMFEVDAAGNILRELGRMAPRDGNSVELSIDIDIQNIAFDALGNNKGIVVVSRPDTGEILASVSKPSYDPNIFNTEDRASEAETLFTDEKNNPLVNRVISGLYPPGSTFKLVVALGALEEGKITEKTLIEDTGEIVINNQFRFPNWYFKQYGKKEGNIDIVRAIKRSNDIFFYKTAEALGLSNLIKWEEKFGLGKKAGVDLPGELEGLVPTDEWKQKVIGDKWYLGDTYHLGIGQGYLLVTPLQVNMWTNVFANGGKLCKPRVAKIPNRPEGTRFQIPNNSQNSNTQKEEQCVSLGLKKETVDLVREGMTEACKTGGTGYVFFDYGKKEVACKTGTAEYGDPKGKTHAWFTMFAPAYAPDISITVLVEGGGEGSVVAAPIAKKILEEYYK